MSEAYSVFLSIDGFGLTRFDLKADAARNRLQAYNGDHETLINIYDRFEDMYVCGRVVAFL